MGVKELDVFIRGTPDRRGQSTTYSKTQKNREKDKLGARKKED